MSYRPSSYHYLLVFNLHMLHVSKLIILFSLYYILYIIYYLYVYISLTVVKPASILDWCETATVIISTKCEAMLQEKSRKKVEFPLQVRNEWLPPGGGV